MATPGFSVMAGAMSLTVIETACTSLSGGELLSVTRTVIRYVARGRSGSR